MSRSLRKPELSCLVYSRDDVPANVPVNFLFNDTVHVLRSAFAITNRATGTGSARSPNNGLSHLRTGGTIDMNAPPGQQVFASARLLTAAAFL